MRSQRLCQRYARVVPIRVYVMVTVEVMPHKVTVFWSCIMPTLQERSLSLVRERFNVPFPPRRGVWVDKISGCVYACNGCLHY